MRCEARLIVDVVRYWARGREAVYGFSVGSTTLVEIENGLAAGKVATGIVRVGGGVAGRAEARPGIIVIIEGTRAGSRVNRGGGRMGVRIVIIIPCGFEGGLAGGFELWIGNFAEEFGFGVLGGCGGLRR